MQLHPLKLVTIVTELVLKDQILPKLLEMGASGYNYFETCGYGSRGARSGPGDESLKIEVVCPPPVADAILTYISHHYFDNYAYIAWVTDVAAVRGHHYQLPGA